MKKCKEQGYYIIDSNIWNEKEGELFILKIIGKQSGSIFLYNGVRCSKYVRIDGEVYAIPFYHEHMDLSKFNRLSNFPSEKRVIDRADFIESVKLNRYSEYTSEFDKILGDEEV